MIILTEQILEIAYKRAHGGDSKRVGHRKPANSRGVAHTLGDEGERCTREIERDLGACCREGQCNALDTQ